MQGNINIQDSTITTNLSFRQLVLMNMQQLTNFPYIEKDFDALTDYELLCLVVKFLNDVIANQNEQNASITRMYESFLALQDYVNNTKDELEDAFNNLDDYVRNYFDNLDVQEEINNKLDQMLEDGVLEQIIEQFIHSTALWCFDTVADMKQGTNLINGSFVKTLGYYAVNDGGHGEYVIVDDDTLVDDGGSIHVLSNGLRAKLIVDDNINVAQFGAYGDNFHDDTNYIKNAIKVLKYGMTLNFINNKRYKISETIYFPMGANYNGNKCILDGSQLNNQFIINYGNTVLSNDNELFIDYIFCNFAFYNTGSNIVNGIYINKEISINNIYVYGLNRTIQCTQSYIDFIKIRDINILGKNGNDYSIDTGYIGDSRIIERVHLHTGTTLNNSENNLLLIKDGHNNIIVDTVINGNIKITGSNVNIRNVHNENGNIDINNSDCLIESGFLWKRVGITPFVIRNSKVILENINISYRDSFDYSSDECIDIDFDNISVIIINNVYKIMQKTLINFKHQCSIKTTNDDFNKNSFNNSISSITRKFTDTNYKITAPNLPYGSIISTIYKDNNITWKKETGSYYYRALCIYDVDRKIGYKGSLATPHIELTENASGSLIPLNGFIQSNLRLYRGNASDNFTNFVDIGVNSNNIMDNGIICNGNRWETLESDDYSQWLTCYNYRKINDVNIETYSTVVPSYGTWVKGDIIINSNPTAGGIYGWICTNSGTPGMWKVISNIES